MKNYKYIVEISMKNKKLYGKLQMFKKGKTEPQTYTFLPTNILCDLTIMTKNHYFKKDKNIEYMKYKYEYAFGTPIYINKKENMYYYYPLAELIKESILNNKHITLEKLEKIKCYFDISYSISIKEDNPLYKKFKNAKNKFTYTPLQYGYCDIEKILEDNKNDTYKYIYQCNTLTEVIFSIWYFLISNNYNKIRKCRHCEKLYFYRHSNDKYCIRNSPFKNYEHLECKQAVKTIKKLINRRYIKIKNKLLDEYSYKLFQKYDNLFKKYKNIANNEPTTQNLKNLVVLTNKKYMEKHFYKKIN